MGIQGLFNVAYQRFTALFRQRHRQQTALPQDAACPEQTHIQMAEQLLRQRQLPLGLGALLLEFLLVVDPEGCQQIGVFHRQGDEFRAGVLLVEFVDVVALAAVVAAGEVGQVLRVVEVVLPCPFVGDGDAGPAERQLARLGFRHHGEDGPHALAAAVVLDGGQGGVHVALRAGNGIVELGHAVDAVADDKAAVGEGVLRAEVAPPHVFHAGAVFAQAVGAGFVIGAQQRHALCGHGGEV